MSSFSFSAPSPSSPHLRPRESSPVRNMTSSSPLQSPSRLVRRLSRSITMTPPSSSKSLRKSSEFYSECDRFIPSRAASNLEDAFERMDSNDPTSRQENQGTMNCLHNNQNMMNNLIRSELLWEPLQSMKTDASSSLPNAGSSSSPITSPSRPTSSVLRFSSSGSNTRRFSSDSVSSNSPMNSRNSFGPSPTSQRTNRTGSKRTVRKISRIPYKVLDAPALQDDYYLNLVDWSSTNFLSVALGNSVYLWSASNLKVVKLCELEGGDSVTAISWALEGNQLAIGTNTGKILIWDTLKKEQIRELVAHTSRVGTLAWNSTVVASGSRDKNIYVHDIRIRGTAEDSSSSTTNSPSSSVRSSFQSSVRASLPSADHRASGASSSGYGQTISNDRRRSRDHVSDSVLDEDEDNEDDYADMDLEGGGEGEEEEDVEGRRSTSVSDVQRQGREERRAVDAVRAAAGLGALTERERDREPESDSFSGRSSFASSVTSDYRSDRGRERAREGLFEDGYSRLSTEPSFSLFDDRNEDSDGESSSRRYRSSGIRLNMDSDAGEGSRDSTAIEGVRISSGSGDLRARSSSGSGSGGTIDRQYSSASASGNPFAASRSQRSSSLASAGLGRDRSSTSSSRELDFGREGEAGISGGEEFFPDGFISDPRVRIVRSPLVSDPGTLHWDNLPDRDSSGGALSGLSGSIDEIGRTGLGGSGVTSNSSSAAIESLYGAVHANLPTEQSADTVGGSARGGSCVVGELIAHKQEVCGLKWSFDERLLASGGNDNKLYVWAPNLRAGGSSREGSRVGVDTDPVCEFSDHCAAVKAVGWSPHQHGTLASGGGTADRHIRFWNALTATPLHRIDTGSQVCNLMWSKNVNEIVSTHGYSLNQVIVWKYPTMQKIATLTGHTLRVLYLAMSPDGQSIVTGAGDESLRFWNIFPSPRSSLGMRVGPSLLLPTGADIR